MKPQEPQQQVSKFDQEVQRIDDAMMRLVRRKRFAVCAVILIGLLSLGCGDPLPELDSIQTRLEQTAREIGAVGLEFDGDPRGCTAKLKFADGATNDWGKEGWCIPN